MNPDTLLAKTLSSPDRSDEVLSRFFEAAPEEPISKMREAVSAMRRQVDESIKTSSVEELSKIADAWGRQLAQEDWEKNAAALDVAKAGIAMARKTGPVTRAVAGGLAGGYLAHKTAPNDYDEQGRKKGHKLRTLAGAAAGAAGLAATHPTGRSFMAQKAQQGMDKAKSLMAKEKVSSIETLRATMEKDAIDWAGAMGAAKAMGGKLLNKAGPAVGQALQKAKSLGAVDPVRRGMMGAAAGAGVGAVRHYMKPKDPNTGQRQGSLVGSMVGHGLAGGAVGLAAPHAAQMALESNPVKKMMRGEFRATPPSSVVRESGSVMTPNPSWNKGPVGPGGGGAPMKPPTPNVSQPRTVQNVRPRPAASQAIVPASARTIAMQ